MTELRNNTAFVFKPTENEVQIWQTFAVTGGANFNRIE